MINRIKLLELLGGDDSFVEKFITSFKEEVQKQIPMMHEYLLNGNRLLLANTAHMMKTQSAYIGLDDVVTIAEKIERETDSGVDLQIVKADLNEMEILLYAIIKTESD